MTRPLDARASGPLAVATRSGVPESVHLGAAVDMDADGVELHRIGDPGRLIYPRSALKPFQTVAARRAGARFPDEQAVIVSSSHTGTPRHIALVREVREETGLIIMPGELVDVVAREELTGEPGVVRVIYAASVTGGTLASSGEGEARWRPLDEAAAASKRDGEIIRGWRERTAKVTAAR